ncbi:MAG: hypothetical protein ABI556_09095 [Gemmatimonadales bacterium]
MRRSIYAIVLVAATSGCSESAVTWSDVVHTDVPQQPSESIRGLPAPAVSRCEVTLRIATDGESAFAAWFAVRRDSSVLLLTARSMNGAEWSKPVVADSTDRGTRGCGRPPPAIAADPSSRYVHLAYFIEPAGGGVFFAHSMDSGATFHSAVPIVFGNNPVRTSVASNGERVVVAYEDPNSRQPMIALALSKTMGHLFEKRVAASTEYGRARQPVVRVTGDSIRLWWSEYSENPAVSATRPMYRAGLWK